MKQLDRGKNEDDALHLVDTVDKERADFIQKYFSVEWPDRAIYHGMLNTAFGDEAVVDIILNTKRTYESAVATGHLSDSQSQH